MAAWDAVDVSCEKFASTDRVAQELNCDVVKTFRVEQASAAGRIWVCSFARATAERMVDATHTGHSLSRIARSAVRDNGRYPNDSYQVWSPGIQF